MGTELQSENALSSSVRAGLAAICGADNVATVEGVLAVAPGDVQQLSEIMRLANAAGLRVSPRGAGTKMAWIGKRDVDLVILTRRMNAVSEHVWQDMTCTVGAGCTWSELQRALAKRGQFVALDPLWPKTATVGGIVSANDSGALRLAYGGLRDLVLGMTIVLADGTIARSGGKVVKNVAGYDLPKLMCGAFGTLGVIAEVTFRLHSLPQQARTYTSLSASSGPLHDLLMRLRDSHYSVQSMQLRAASEGNALDVKLAALPQVLDTQGETLRTMAGAMDLRLENAGENVWLERQRLVEMRDAVPFKATMLPGEIASVSDAVVRMGGQSVTQATGILYGVVDASKAGELASLRSKLDAQGGSLSYLGTLPKNETDRWGIAPDALRWMQGLKREFDPARMLNPRCYEAGI